MIQSPPPPPPPPISLSLFEAERISHSHSLSMGGGNAPYRRLPTAATNPKEEDERDFARCGLQFPWVSAALAEVLFFLFRCRWIPFRKYIGGWVDGICYNPPNLCLWIHHMRPRNELCTFSLRASDEMNLNETRWLMFCGARCLR